MCRYVRDLVNLLRLEPVDTEGRSVIREVDIAVRTDGEHGVRRLDMLRWGLIPSWAKDAAIGNRMINARGETVAEKPAFRAAFKRRRCLILADGYYEWRKEGKRKQPYYFRMKDDRPFAFAGLWELWSDAASTSSPRGETGRPSC